jgi:hypothetical protein
MRAQRAAATTIRLLTLFSRRSKPLQGSYHLCRGTRRRQPRFWLDNQPPCLMWTTNVSAVLRPSAYVCCRRDRTLFVAGLVLRCVNRCNSPQSVGDLSIARSWSSKYNDCSSACGQNGPLSCECFAPRSGNEAGGSIQAAIRVTPTRRLVLRRRANGQFTKFLNDL